MSYVELLDEKGRMFNIEYSIERGMKARYSQAMDRMIEGDGDEIVIEGATIVLDKGSKSRVVSLSTDKLYRYINYNRICDEIEYHEELIGD